MTKLRVRKLSSWSRPAVEFGKLYNGYNLFIQIAFIYVYVEFALPFQR